MKPKLRWARRAIARGCLCTDMERSMCEMHYGMLPEVSNLNCQCDCHEMNSPNTVRGKLKANVVYGKFGNDSSN